MYKLIDGITEIAEGQEVSEHFNDKFSTIADLINVKPNMDGMSNFLSNFDNSGLPYFDFHPVSEESVVKIILSLKNTHSSGWDEIPVDLIRKCAHIVSRLNLSNN